MRIGLIFWLNSFAICLLFVTPTNILAQLPANQISEEVKVDLLFSTYTEKEFIPQISRNIYTWQENTRQIKSEFTWHKSNLSIAWKETSIEQKNELFNDIDFAIESKGPILGMSVSLGSISCSTEIDIEQYEDSSQNAFYSLGNSTGSANDLFYSGFFKTSYSGRNTLTTLSYNRFRDTDPLYDPTTNRAELNIRARELYGISLGWHFSQEWQFTNSVFFEKYDTGTPDQFNINSALTYRPKKIKQLNLSLGSGYYTAEKETIVNFATGYDFTWRLFDLNLLYQLEYSANERSLLHEVTTSIKYYINNSVSLSLQGDYGKETGDDRDSASSITGNLNFIF